MNLKKMMGLLVLITAIYSCSDNNNKGHNEIGGLVDVSILASQYAEEGSSQTGLSSRTEINTEDWSSINWSENDNIYVWGTSDKGVSFPLNQAEFVLKKQESLLSKVIFTSRIPELPSGEYDYYSTYPNPIKVEGSIVTHNIKDLQNGVYDGVNDIMVSNPVSGPQLSPSLVRYLDLDFRHLVHALRIEVPKSRNRLGEPIKKMRIDFPTEVVGDLSFDMSNVNATIKLTKGKKRIELEFSTPIIDDGKYFWVFIAPTVINGEVVFTSMGETGKVASNISVTLNKEFLSGKITPIKLTIPTESPKTTIEITEGVNNLGETLNKVTATAPEGAIFTNGTNEQVVDIDSNGKFNLTYYANWCNAEMQSAPIALALESENAIVSSTFVAVDVVVDDINKYVISVPYLLYENFNDLLGHNSNWSDGSMLDDYGLIGWSGSCWVIHENKSLEIQTYNYDLVNATDNNYGRINTVPLTGIKGGKQVKLSVSFNVSGSINRSVGQFNKKFTIACVFGRTSKTGIEPGGLLNDLIKPETVIEQFDILNGGSATNIPMEKSYTLEAADSSTRLSWGCTERKYGFVGVLDWKFYMFIDNVKVFIVK